MSKRARESNPELDGRTFVPFLSPVRSSAAVISFLPPCILLSLLSLSFQASAAADADDDADVDVA